MSDGDKNLKVGVEIAQTGSGGKDAANDLNEIRKATDRAGESTKEHEKKILGLNTEMGEQRKIIQGIRDAVPGLSEAFNLFLNPLVTILGVVIELFMKAKEALAEWNKELDEMGEKLAQAEFLPGIEGKLEVQRHLNEEMVKYNQHLGDLISLNSQLKTQEDDLQKVREAKALADERIAAAQERAAIAMVEQNQKAGRITEAQAAAQIADIKLAGEGRGGAAQLGAQQARIGQMEADLTDAQTAEGPQRELVRQLAEQESKFASDKKKAQEDLASEEKRQDDLKKEMFKTAENAANKRKFAAKYAGDPDSPILRAGAERAEEEAAQARAAYDQSFANTHEGGSLFNRANAPDIIADELKKAQEALDDFVTKIKTLPEAIDTARKVEGEIKRGNTGAAAGNAAAALSEFMSGNRGADLGGGLTVGLLEQFNNSAGKTDAASKEVNAKVADLFNNHISFWSDQHRLLVAFIAHMGNQAAQLADLQRAFDQQHQHQMQQQRQSGNGY